MSRPIVVENFTSRQKRPVATKIQPSGYINSPKYSESSLLDKLAANLKTNS